VTPHEIAVQALLTRDPLFGNCLNIAGTLPEPVLRTPAGFPGLLRIILEQQVSTRAGDAMWRKLCAVTDPVTPEALLTLDEETLRACGFSRQKMAYARGLAGDVASGRLDIEAVHCMPDDEALEALIRVKGIGRWSAEVYLLLVLGRPDVWPVDDLAVAVGLQWLLGRDERPPRAELVALGEPLRPYRSTAARLVWHYYVSVWAERRRTKPSK
jgi:DNA-3-methyladenine glycosylase II